MTLTTDQHNYLHDICAQRRIRKLEPDHLNSSMIPKAMQQQAYHQIPECCFFMMQNVNWVSFARVLGRRRRIAIRLDALKVLPGYIGLIGGFVWKEERDAAYCL